jgi:hypothetical protein
MLAHEILSRGLRDRRAVARYAGLTGSPGSSQNGVSSNAGIGAPGSFR